jgi:hypothetical protein
LAQTPIQATKPKDFRIMSSRNVLTPAKIEKERKTLGGCTTRDFARDESWDESNGGEFIAKGGYDGDWNKGSYNKWPAALTDSKAFAVTFLLLNPQ